MSPLLVSPYLVYNTLDPVIFHEYHKCFDRCIVKATKLSFGVFTQFRGVTMMIKLKRKFSNLCFWWKAEHKIVSQMPPSNYKKRISVYLFVYLLIY